MILKGVKNRQQKDNIAVSLGYPDIETAVVDMYKTQSTVKIGKIFKVFPNSINIWLNALGVVIRTKYGQPGIPKNKKHQCTNVNKGVFAVRCKNKTTNRFLCTECYEENSEGYSQTIVYGT